MQVPYVLLFLYQKTKMVLCLKKVNPRHPRLKIERLHFDIIS